MIEPTFRWRFPQRTSLPAELVDAGAELGLSARLVRILLERGLRVPADLTAFAAEPSAGLNDPRLLPDADRFLERCVRARSAGETVLVFGDFDADGVTGLAIMAGALRAFGLEVVPYVPSRLEEGHGLSLRAVAAARERGVQLIVTVDCGSTSNAEIAAAVEAGIDVLVTDHHRVPPDPPAAAALVNPHRPDSAYPDRRLAGSGVAFKLAELLLAGHVAAPQLLAGFAQLATIGTVADVAPILGENRAIARLGLASIRGAPRPGLEALLARASILAANVDLESVAFSIAPRLNAAGRVGEAMEAARLLMTDDPAEATELAAALETANDTRRDLTKEAMIEAETILAATPDDAATVVLGSWPVGVIGLVAGRLAETRGRPAVVGTMVGEVIRGSSRSAAGFDLAAALEACDDLLIRHGGHPGAAGFECDPGHWVPLKERLVLLAAAALARSAAAAAAEGIPGAAEHDRRPELRIDVALPAAEVDYPLLRELASLAPTGPGNPEPLVAVLGLTVSRIRSATGGHAQLTLRRERDVLDGIAFGRADLVDGLQEGDRVDVVARLASRTFGGYESIQLEVRDVAASGIHPEAAGILGIAPILAADAARGPEPALQAARTSAL